MDYTMQRTWRTMEAYDTKTASITFRNKTTRWPKETQLPKRIWKGWKHTSTKQPTLPNSTKTKTTKSWAKSTRSNSYNNGLKPTTHNEQTKPCPSTGSMLNLFCAKCCRFWDAALNPKSCDFTSRPSRWPCDPRCLRVQTLRRLRPSNHKHPM